MTAPMASAETKKNISGGLAERSERSERELEASLAATERGTRGLGEALLRLAERRHLAELSAVPAPTAEDRLFMRALMDAFGEAESEGSVCVTSNDAAGALMTLLEGSGSDQTAAPADDEAAFSGLDDFDALDGLSSFGGVQDDAEGQLAGDGLGPLGESPLALYGQQVEAGLRSLRALGLAGTMSELAAAADARAARRERAKAGELPVEALRSRLETADAECGEAGEESVMICRANRSAPGACAPALPPIPPLIVDEPPKKPAKRGRSAKNAKGFDYDAANARIYTARNAMEELELARRIYRLAKARPVKLSAKQEALVAEFAAGGATPSGEPRWALDADQLAALRLAAERPFAVITGGPGTGKTSIVAKVLEVILAGAEERATKKAKKEKAEEKAADGEAGESGAAESTETPHLRIALAAPTGKATSRMRQSIVKSLAEADLPRLSALIAADAAKPAEERALREHTIHKWLVMPTPSGGWPSPEHPLPADVLVVDEASMIDVHLAARLFRAVSPETRVIVLGDKHQLAAVGPGAVFADLSAADGAVRASVATLRTSWRFPQGCAVERLAAAVNEQGEKASEKSGAVKEVLAVLSEPPQPGARYRVSWSSEPFGSDGSGLSDSAKAWIDEMSARYAAALMPFLDAVDGNLPADETRRRLDALWEALSSFRALAANRRGPQSVDAANARFMANLAAALEAAGRLGDESPETLPGRAVIVRTNDDMLDVFNGDVGIVVPERTEGGLRRTVWFGDRGFGIPLALLPAHDTAFAMTIHQSQGSEFTDVAVFLPAREHSGLATRELLYTAITRTKATAAIFGSAAALERAVITATERASGLKDRLAEIAKAEAAARKAKKEKAKAEAAEVGLD